MVGKIVEVASYRLMSTIIGSHAAATRRRSLASCFMAHGARRALETASSRFRPLRRDIPGEPSSRGRRLEKRERIDRVSRRTGHAGRCKRQHELPPVETRGGVCQRREIRVIQQEDASRNQRHTMIGVPLIRN